MKNIPKHNAKLFELFENFSDQLLIIADSDCFIMDISSNCSHVLGITKEKLIGKNLKTLIHIDDIPVFEKTIGFIFTESTNQIVSVRIKCAITQNCLYSFRIIKSGDLIKFIAGKTDETSVIRHPVEIKDTNLKYLSSQPDEIKSVYRSIIDYSNDGVIYIDKSGSIVTWNKTCEKLFGADASEAIGQAGSKFSSMTFDTGGNPLNAADHPFTASLSTGENCKNTILKVVRKDNNISWITVNATPLFLHNETSPDAVIVIITDITELYELTERLKKSEKLYKLVADKTTDVIWLMDLNGNSLFVSSSVEKFTGFSIEEYLKQSIETRFTKESAKTAREIFNKRIDDYYIKGDLPDNFVEKIQLEYKCKDGSSKWGQVIITPYFDDNGNLAGIHGVTRDISDEIKFRYAYMQKEEQYARLFETMHQGFALHKIICDENNNPVDYTFLDVNPAFEKITGLKKADIIGRNVLDILPKTESIWIENYGKVALGGETLDFENFASEMNKYFNVVAYCPEPEHFATIISDITEKKQNELNLIKLSQAVEQNPSTIVITDINGNIEYANQQFTKLTGYSIEEALHKTPGIIKSGETPPDVYKDLWKTIKSGKIWHGELKNKKKNGEFYWENAIISPVFNNNGKIINFLAIKQDITEKIKFKETIKIQENQYRYLLENLPNIVLIHQNGEIVFANNYAAKETKLSINEITGKKLIDFVHPDYKETVAKNIQLRNEGISIENYEIKVVINGNTLDVYLYLHELLYNGKNSVMIIIIDITERKKHELELEESEQKFKILAESSQFGIFMYSDDKWIYANPAAERITGFSYDELMTMNLCDNIHDDYKKIVKSRAISRLKGEDNNRNNYEVKIITKTGEIKWCLLSSALIKYKGIPSGLLSVADISDLKKVENELKISEEKYRNLAENSSDITWALDTNFNFTYVSTGDRQMRGFSDNEMIGKSFWEILKPEGVELVKHGNSKRQKKEDSWKKPGTYLYELEQICKDGSWIWTEINITPFRNENGELAGYHGMTRNISERKKTEAALKRSDELKTEFLNNISHEIRTPLNGILGFANLIINSGVSDKLKNKYYELMRSSSKRLLNTIEDYMDIALLVSDNLKISFTEFGLIGHLSSIYNEFFNLSLQKKLFFNFIYPNEYSELYIITDPELIKKVMFQLLSNAFKFTETGKIEFGFSVDGENIKFFVKDSGSGIKPETQSKIFDYFYKTDFHHDKTNDGSGLGLSIVKGIIEALSGKIFVKSDIGTGTEISFTIPAGKIKMEKEKQHKLIINAVTDKSKKILIAEDDDTNYLYLENLLRTNSFTNTLRAYNGAEAAEMCKNDPEIAIVLMDIKMPVMNGVDATKIIKKIRNDLPVIATTAYAMKDEKDSIMSEDFDDYISKPYHVNDLLKVLSKYLPEPKA